MTILQKPIFGNKKVVYEKPFHDLLSKENKFVFGTEALLRLFVQGKSIVLSSPFRGDRHQERP